MAGHPQGPGLCYRTPEDIASEIPAKPAYLKKEGPGDFVIIPKHTEHHDGCVVARRIPPTLV